MSRRIATRLLLAAAVIAGVLSLSGCIIVPPHGGHYHDHYRGHYRYY